MITRWNFQAVGVGIITNYISGIITNYISGVTTNYISIDISLQVFINKLVKIYTTHFWHTYDLIQRFQIYSSPIVCSGPKIFE